MSGSAREARARHTVSSRWSDADRCRRVQNPLDYHQSPVVTRSVLRALTFAPAGSAPPNQRSGRTRVRSRHPGRWAEYEHKEDRRPEMAAGAHAAAPGTVRSLIPARIDRLPWSPFHTRMVVALGVAWILDGLEISIASAVGDTLTHPETLALSSTQVGLLATVYLAGEVVGALVFGAL